MIYLDNAATTGIKPKPVRQAVLSALRENSANPGRSGHQASIRAAERVYRTREAAAAFFGCEKPENVIFTPSCTAGINTVLFGMAPKIRRVLISNLEHNAVFRPCYALSRDGGMDYGIFDAMNPDVEEELERRLTPDTGMIFCTHASNVCGKVLPIERIGRFCAQKGILFGVDAAQSAGVFPIHMQKMQIDFLCVAPHKGLYAPMGSGILLLRKPLLRPLIYGGTGTHSAMAEQPSELPEMLESGTLNVPGIAGIEAGIRFVRQQGGKIFAHEDALCRAFCRRLEGLASYHLYRFGEQNAPVISLNHREKDSNEVAGYLADNGVAVRAGLHCAPLAHETLGTGKTGTVRISPGLFNTAEQMNTVLGLLSKFS